MKILIIEDESELANSIAEYLESEQYRCELATTFSQAMGKIHAYDYDCILLDLMLPGGDGLTILEALKKENKQDGVIIISAKDSLDDKIKGLKIGADDYLAKPFHLSELNARIYSVVRRKHYENSNKIVINELEVDLLAKTAYVNSQRIELTKKEYELLIYFIKNKNRVISKPALAEHLSGDMADTLDNHGFVYAHTKNLRKKLMKGGSQEYIKTVYGLGYKWEE